MIQTPKVNFLGSFIVYFHDSFKNVDAITLCNDPAKTQKGPLFLFKYANKYFKVLIKLPFYFVFFQRAIKDCYSQNFQFSHETNSDRLFYFIFSNNLFGRLLLMNFGKKLHLIIYTAISNEKFTNPSKVTVFLKN